MKLIDVTVPLDAHAPHLSRQHAVQPGADQAARARRQLERLDAPHERALRAPTSTRRAIFSTTDRASKRCRSSCCSAGPASSKSRRAPAIAAEDLDGHRFVGGHPGADQDAQLAAVGLARVPRPDYVGVTESGARHLVEHGIKVVGVDYLSVEQFKKPGAPAHHVLLGAGTIVIEGLNLRDVEPGIYEMFCLPLRIVGADGAPARVVLRRS